MMQTLWVTLYLPPRGEGTPSLRETLTASLEEAGGIAYDPFGIMPGLSYPRAVKLFIAPPSAGWTRLVCSPDTPVSTVVAGLPLVCEARIDAELVPSITAHEDGQPADPQVALGPWISDAAQFAAHLAAPRTGASAMAGIPTGALPQNVRAMSGSVSSRQVERMVQSMTGSIGKGDRAAAQNALRSVDWESGAGRWMREALACIDAGITVQPDYATVSTAYRTARRLERNPKATLYAGDAEAREAVPDALSYLPVFYGWKA